MLNLNIFLAFSEYTGCPETNWPKIRAKVAINMSANMFRFQDIKC